VKRFVQDSWNLGLDDIVALRCAGLDDRDIVDWAQIASLQTWLVMSADGGGVSLDSEASHGQAVGCRREDYHGAEAGLTAAGIKAQSINYRAPANGLAWVDANTDDKIYQETACWATDRYGFVPNLLKAESISPGHYELHQEALSLLDKPQSKSLSRRQHAMVRALVSTLNRCAYSADTTRQYLLNETSDENLANTITSDYRQYDFDKQDRLILDFATKMACNSYKVVPKDAEAFTEAGLDHEAYVEIDSLVIVQCDIRRKSGVSCGDL